MTMHRVVPTPTVRRAFATEVAAPAQLRPMMVPVTLPLGERASWHHGRKKGLATASSTHAAPTFVSAASVVHVCPMTNAGLSTEYRFAVHLGRPALPVDDAAAKALLRQIRWGRRGGLAAAVRPPATG